VVAPAPQSPGVDSLQVLGAMDAGLVAIGASVADNSFAKQESVIVCFPCGYANCWTGEAVRGGRMWQLSNNEAPRLDQDLKQLDEL
jgi:hypothetical protein